MAHCVKEWKTDDKMEKLLQRRVQKHGSGANSDNSALNTLARA